MNSEKNIEDERTREKKEDMVSEEVYENEEKQRANKAFKEKTGIDEAEAVKKEQQFADIDNPEQLEIGDGIAESADTFDKELRKKKDKKEKFR